VGLLHQPVSVVIFEGGRPRSSIEEEMAAARTAVVLDTIETIGRAGEIDQVILCTNFSDLAHEAASLGAVVDFKTRKFRFGRRLLDIVERHRLSNVVYLGGPAAPLLEEEDWRFVARQLRQRKNVVLQNNVQSPDIIAFTPAQALAAIPEPESDNEMGFALRDLGLERILLPNSARVNFDLDTPTDMLILRVTRKGGRRTMRVLDGLSWDDSRIRSVQQVMVTPGAELVVAGRVGPSVVTYLNMNIPLRVRLFSEERGMKALGRQRRGEVVSLLGFLYERVGAREFFSLLARCGQAVLLDSRVLFAHWKKDFSDWDRFQSDLGRYDLVKDDALVEFTRGALESPIPVVLGGHCLVSGGLWLLAETLVDAQAACHARGAGDLRQTAMGGCGHDCSGLPHPGSGREVRAQEKEGEVAPKVE
jgi:hypothetical protein